MAKRENSKVVRRAFAARLLLVLACLAASPAAAGYREPCWVRAELRSGEWSQTFAVVCNYWTGRELNERSGGTGYQGSRTFVVFRFWGTRRVVRISESVGCLFEADLGCAETLSRVLHGRDEDVRYRRGKAIQRDWIICQPGYGRRCGEE